MSLLLLGLRLSGRFDTGQQAGSGDAQGIAEAEEKSTLKRKERYMHRATLTVAFLFLMSLLRGCGSKEKTGGPAPAPEVKGSGGAARQALTPDEEAKLKQAVAEGDALYDAGMEIWRAKGKSQDRFKKFDDACEKYMVVVNAPQPLPDKAAMARVYGRVIDNALGDSKKNKALAKEVALKALRHDILPTCKSRDASPILQAARRELKAEDKELDDWLDKEDKKGGKASASPDREELVEKIQKGMSRQAVIAILGQPDVSMPLGRGQAMLYYLSDTEAFFISIDKNGNVFTADRQERSK